MDLKQLADGSLEIWSDTEGKGVARVGGPKTPTGGTAATWRLPNYAKIPFATVTSLANTTAGLVNFQVSLNDDVIITRTQAYVSTTSPATSIAIGTSTTSGASAANLIANVSPATSGLTDSTTAAYLAAGGYITATGNSTSATLVGAVYVEYYKA